MPRLYSFTALQPTENCSSAETGGLVGHGLALFPPIAALVDALARGEGVDVDPRRRHSDLLDRLLQKDAKI
jgi:hypothetical protein